MTFPQGEGTSAARWGCICRNASWDQLIRSEVFLVVSIHSFEKGLAVINTSLFILF